MNQIHDLPVDKDYGLNFNYAQWSADTVITLAQVPWNSDYRDIVRFDSASALDNYITNLSGPTHRITKASYAKFGRPIRLELPYNAVQKYNYLRAANPLQPIAGDVQKSFYYFIVGAEYLNPSTTEIYVQLDIWQTFGYGVTFGNCYIEQGHIGIANENQFTDNGRGYLTIPEGLDLGGEYQIVDQWKRDIATARGNADYSVLVTSTVALNMDPGTVEAPKLNSATGSSLENLPNGAENYVFADLTHFMNFMSAFSDKPWVTQGIISITAIPNFADYGMNATSTQIEGVSVYEVGNGSLDTKKTPMNTGWRTKIMLGPNGRYQHLKKFLTFPYCLLEMTSYTGTPLVIKPESWSDPDATVVEVPHFAQPGARLMFYPYRYNAAQPGPDPETDTNGLINDGGEFLDMATGIFNFPTFSLVNNGYMAFMASNANGIAFQHQSAEWSQQRALAGNQTSYDQASAGIGLSKDLNQMGMSAATQSTNLANQTGAFRAIQGSINSLGQIGNGPGGVIGAATGIANQGIGLAIDVNNNNQSLGIANNLAAGQNRASTDNAGYIRDTNKGLADWSANGDYQNQIAGINAKVQDARMIQPTTSGQVGGDAFNLATYKWGYDIKVKMLQPAAMAAQGEYWLRYGYKVNRFGSMPASFQVMNRFTYWKLKETYITSANCPETFKQVIRGIFEKGVTVWKNPTDIGRIDLAQNSPLQGVRL